MAFFRRLVVSLVAFPLVACSKDGPTQTSATCTPATADDTIALQVLQGTRVSFSATGKCVSLSGTDARYLLVPQYATQGSEPQQTAYVIGGGSLSAAASFASVREPLAVSLARAEREVQGRAQRHLDGWLRAQERALPPPFERVSALRAAALSAVVFDAVRSFKVLGDIDGGSFVTVGARLQYTGANLVIYVDTLTPAPFTDSVLTSLGNLFDNTLYPIDTAAFGPPSDVDGNGKIIVLMTPRVNALVTASQCRASGFITGYFFGFDIGSTDTTRSNRGEIFYTLAPDPNATVSCAHRLDEVERLVPATFIHELQHMISFGQHFVLRGGQDEDVWLNEGLSLIAEELGSRYYEDKYPPPSGRTNPSQLFPDSSQTFIGSNLEYAYDYLAGSPDTSITTFKDQGALSERGGAFLFLRWLGDQKGQGIFKALVQTNKTGITNVAAAAGEPFATLFGDFGIAVYTDSLPGIPRASIPARYRFTSRNLRQLFARLQSIGAVGPNPFPIVLDTLPAGVARQETMVQGTMDFYTVLTSGGQSAASVRFTRPDGRALPAALVPQMGIFRLPQP